MSVILSAEEAYIKPVSVDVKAIRIGKKQMTQAVFKQIPNAVPYDYDLDWRGTLWGHVRYCDKDCGSEEHYHVIWQDGNVLKKDIIDYRSLEQDHGSFKSERISVEHLSYINRFLYDYRYNAKDEEWISESGDVVSRCFSVSYANYSFDFRKRIEHTEKSMGLLGHTQTELTSSTYRGLVKSMLEDGRTELESIKKVINARWREIQNLEQLFIAV